MSERSVLDSALHQAENGRVFANGGLIRVGVTLTHVTPLMMNAMSEAALLAIRDKVKAPKTAAKPSLREEAASKVHTLTDGRPHLPAKALYATLINAGQFVRLDGKRQVSTQTKTILPGMLSLEDAIVPLFKPGSDDVPVWEVDIQQGRNPNGGEAVCIVRPRFDEWEVRFVLEIDQQQMPVAMARELVSIAGRRIGFLEYTPRHKGTFGRSAISRWEPLKEDY